MKRTIKYIIYIFLLVGSTGSAFAQTQFYKEVQQLKKLDSTSMPAPNSILMIGSSSFKKWKDVQDYFPSYPIVNRAFGGSKFPDLIYYAEDVIAPYQPKQILVYCGDNDLASSDTITPQIVLLRFQELFTIIRNYHPKASVVYVSIKPSPKREKLMSKMVETNMLIKKFLKKKKRTDYVDVYHNMLLDNGKPDTTLFVEDNLHMNAKGYAIWKKAIEPKLLK